jgi:hypothetical protein
MPFTADSQFAHRHPRHEKLDKTILKGNIEQQITTNCQGNKPCSHYAFGLFLLWSLQSIWQSKYDHYCRYIFDKKLQAA